MVEYHNNNNFYAMMKDVYSNITNTDLWTYLESDDKGHTYAIDISRVCFDACTVSETITERLPNFTKHDPTHIKCVLDWMAKLLTNINILTKEETALLIMSACCHDVGMSISDSNMKELMNDLETGRLGQDLKEYFKKNKKIENEYKNRDKGINNKELFERIIRDFVRQTHHLRVEECLQKETFSGLQGALRKELIISLCKSHGEDLGEIKDLIDDTSGVRIYLLAILLRLADILNYDIKRSPEIKFIHSGLDNPQSCEEIVSAKEHLKNQICHWTIHDDSVVCTGECPDNQILHDILDYAEWVKKEVDSSNRLLNYMKLDENPLTIKQVKTNLTGAFISGDYKITVNAKKVIKLLGSENVYGDRRAFLAELIQNSIDAILVRTNVDPGYTIADGKIDVYIWEDDDYIWTRVDDNGFGMDENIIKNYFLTVGESYYNSFEFKKIHREGKNAFTPINRFGIGILSCFMNNSDVRLEVETKSIDGENVLRIDITSLDGFYSLYKVDRTDKVKPISGPSYIKDLPDGYNRDYGTSICVKQKKRASDYSINSYISNYMSYINSKIKLPIVDIIIHTPKEHLELTKRNDFVDSVCKLMDGKKYQCIDGFLDVYYLNSLEDFATSYHHVPAIDTRILKDVSVVVIRVRKEMQNKALVNAYKVHSNRSLNIDCDFGKHATVDFLGEWFDSQARQLKPTEKRIATFAKNDVYHANSYITYNGIALLEYSPYDYTAVYCLVNGSWFESFNLAKNDLIGKSEVVKYIKDAVASVVQFQKHRTTLPYEVFEAIEQKAAKHYYMWDKSSEIRIHFPNYQPSCADFRHLIGLSYIYNIHFEIVGELEDGSFNVVFDQHDRIPQRETGIRYNFSRWPLGFIEDNTIFKYYDFINLNYPLIKWLLNNYVELSMNYQNVFRCLLFTIGSFRSQSNLLNDFYSILFEFKRQNCICLDEDILEYMESIKDKTGNPIIYDTSTRIIKSDNI